jgi:tripartite-type tricarboxylate transporter receptor subunit TctC
LLLAAIAFAAPVPADAQSPSGYPNRPVRILVPYGPGGVADTTVRLLAQKLNERLGQQFVIENRPGAGGIMAAKAGASAPPDGYTLALTGNGTAISTSLFKSLPYDVLRDFKSVSVMAWLDLTIATKGDGPLKTVSDIVAAAKKDPGKLNFGTIAPGSTQHLSALLFMLTGDIKVTMVTFRTTPDLVTAASARRRRRRLRLSGRPPRAVEQPPASRRRFDRRETLTLDAGCAHRAGERHAGLRGDKLERRLRAGRTPNDVVQFLSKEIREALKSPDIQAKALQFGLDARGTTPEEMQARMRADIEKWGAVIEKAGLEKQ